MDLSACWMSQGWLLTPASPRSCELSPGHALEPSARVTGVCPVGLQDRRPSRRPRPGIVADLRIPLSRLEDHRDAPLGGAKCRHDIYPTANVKNKIGTLANYFFLRIRNSCPATRMSECCGNRAHSGEPAASPGACANAQPPRGKCRCTFV